MFGLSDGVWAVLIVQAAGLIALMLKMWRDEVMYNRQNKKIDKVEQATNGLSQRLGDAREAKGFSEGGRAEHDRKREEK